MYIHNEETLLSALSGLTPQARVAFTAAAASRQLGNYEYYAQRFKPDVVSRPREISAELWDALQAGPVALDRWPAAVDELEALIPMESDDWIIVCHALADDALCSLAYALRALLTSEPQEAVWAARCAYDSVDQIAIRLLDVQTGLPDTEIAIRSHPIVQRELARQRRDLDLLAARSDASAIKALRNFAYAEASLTDAERAVLK